MKKLFLFFFLLLGVLGVTLKADPGCGVTIPIEVCRGEQWPPSSGYSTPAPRSYGGVAVDPTTRKYGATWNYDNGDDAKYEAVRLCASSSNSNRCIGYWFSYYYTAVAISSDDKVTKFGASDSYDSAWNSALKECSKAGGNDCEVILMSSSTSEPDEKRWGALAYDPDTKDSGFSWNYYTKREAREAALKSCNSSGCLVSGFQSKYGAMAISPDNKLYFESSGKNMKDAEKQAIKGCKKEFKAKTCEIVLRGNAEAEYK